MKKRNGFIVFDAEDEEPNCISCDNQDKCTGEYCGPEYGWYKYQRTESVPIERMNVCRNKEIK